jgi:hypothetical protein
MFTRAHSGEIVVERQRRLWLIVCMTFHQPIRFTPIYQSRVWGGRRMETLLGAALPDATTPFGEAGPFQTVPRRKV